jgi:hypothetical protein
MNKIEFGSEQLSQETESQAANPAVGLCASCSFVWKYDLWPTLILVTAAEGSEFISWIILTVSTNLF